MIGVLIDDETMSHWNRMKLQKENYNYMIFKIENFKTIKICDAGLLSWDELLGKFEPDRCCFAVVQLPEAKRLCFIFWAPNQSSVREKMVYATSCLALVETLGGFTKTVQASEREELLSVRRKAAIGA